MNETENLKGLNMNTIQNILATIRLIIVAIVSGADVAITEATRKSAGADQTKAASKIERYLRGLSLLIASVIIVPLPFVVVGVVLDWSWLTATAGLIWGLALLVLGVWGSPLGILIGTLWSKVIPPAVGGSLPATTQKTGFFLWQWMGWWTDLPAKVFRSVQDGAKWYVKFVRGVILAECIVALGLTVVPIRTIPEAIPILALAIIVAVLAIVHWDMGYGVWKKFVYAGAIAIAVVLCISFFVPDISRAVVRRLGLAQKNIAAEVEINGLNGLVPAGWFSTQVYTNAPVAMLMPTDQEDLVIPPDKTFVRIELTSAKWSGWVHLPHEWGATDFWSNTNGFWVEYVDEQGKPFWVDERKTCTMKRTIFRISGEGGHFFLKRRT